MTASVALMWLVLGGIAIVLVQAVFDRIEEGRR